MNHSKQNTSRKQADAIDAAIKKELADLEAVRKSGGSYSVEAFCLGVISGLKSARAAIKATAPQKKQHRKKTS
jgi:hypothetical protein